MRVFGSISFGLASRGREAFQHAITATAPQTNAKTTPARTASVVRHLARKWDLYGVVALLVSCTAYGVVVLGQVA